MLNVKQRWRPIERPRRRSSPGDAASVPRFVRPLGLDFIITAEQQVFLIELQHGFGRRGLLELFPAINRRFRQTYWQLRRELGRCEEVIEGMRRICGDKIRTYRLFAAAQPASWVFRGFEPGLSRWLDGLGSDYLLAKPPRGSCGEGILLLERQALRSAEPPSIPGLSWPMLLQEFVRSRDLPGADGAAHVGCIRQIVLMVCDGQTLRLMHLPGYWRVAPAPFVPRADKEALTANISRGARALRLSDEERALLEPRSEQICAELIGHILGRSVPLGEGSRL